MCTLTVLSVRVLISLQSKINALRMGKREYNSNNDCKTSAETVRDYTQRVALAQKVTEVKADGL